MNREFVNIKVDREERPDVDRVYMTFVQATTGGGGWPMSVWLTPELKPFVGGTYFPPEDRYGQPGFRKSCNDRGGVEKRSRQDFRAGSEHHRGAARSGQGPAAVAGKIDADILDAGLSANRACFDAHEGGFRWCAKISAAGHAQSFFRASTRAIRNGFRAARLGDGPVYPAQNGGGRNARSSRRWISSLFGRCFLARAAFRENALRSGATGQRLSRRFSDHGRPAFAAIARDILDYVRRDMTRRRVDSFRPKMPTAPLRSRRYGESGSRAQNGAKARFTFGRNRKSTRRLAKTRELFDFIMASKRTAMLRPEPIRMGSFVGKNILIERHSLAETAI